MVAFDLSLGSGVSKAERLARQSLWAMALVKDIQLLRQHVRLGERHVAEQRRRVVQLERLRAPTGQASDFLRLLESLQKFHQSHLSRLLEKHQRSARLAGLELDEAKTLPLAFGKDESGVSPSE
ncbi:MAG: hypothetical protein E5V74_04650 [Mesorhizobium sp.]|nr:MAG: hypothetical protein E5V86_17295 [Mesorhizobium sp.]TIW05029.1 MAG: hypothetical protein E5V74_04650 [Mesorhizobium sp.]